MPPDSDFYDRLQAVLEAWFAGSETGAAPPLETLCGGDRELMERAARILQSEGEASGVLGALRHAESAADLAVQEIGGYRLVRLLGQGGMGRVFLAEDRALGRFVALKILDPSRFPDEGARERFRREATVTAALDHPNVVPIHGVGSDGGFMWLAMKFLAGPALVDLAEPLPPREAARIGAAVARGLEAAHLFGVVHRDVKPANILLDRGQPYLVDFGLARSVADVTLTAQGAIPGTLAYVAPELLLGAKSLDPRWDVYSLGATLYELAAGRRPFDSEDPEALLRQVLETDPPPLALPRGERDFETIVRRCLRKEPAARYSSAAALAADLDRWLAGEPIEARRVTWLGQLASAARRRPRATALLGSALGVAVVLAATLALQALHDRAARGADVARCQAALERGDVAEAASVLRLLEDRYGAGAELLDLRAWWSGRIALEELLDQVQVRGEAQDRERLRRLEAAVDASGVTARSPRLALLALAFSAHHRGDGAAAAERLERAEREGGRGRATEALRMLFSGSAEWNFATEPRDVDDCVFAVTAMRLGRAPVSAVLAEIERALALDRSSHRAKFAYAAAQHDRGEFLAARTGFEQLERGTGLDAPVIRNAARESLHLGEPERALAALDRIPVADRTADDARNRLIALWHAGRREAFDEALREALAAWPESAAVLFARLVAEQERGDWSAARATSRAILATATWQPDRERARAEELRAELYSASGERASGGAGAEEALAALADRAATAARELTEPHARSIALLVCGEVARERGDSAAAVAQYRAAAGVEPANFAAHAALAVELYAEFQRRRAAGPAAAAAAADLAREAREHAHWFREQGRGEKLPAPPALRGKMALLEAALARLDGDRNACGDAARAALDCARRLGREPAPELVQLADWAAASERP